MPGNRTARPRPLAQPQVREALQQATLGEEKTPAAHRRRRLGIFVFGAVLLALGGIAWGVESDRLEIPGFRFGIAKKIPSAVFFAALSVAIEQLVEALGVRRLRDAATRYNATRVLRLAAALVVTAIAGTVLFSNLYTGLVSFGVISLVLGLAIQAPMTSFLGWIYILVRRPYRVGDRIKIGDATGDVIEVSYLDTTLWEFGGQYLSSDHPSGRVIKFPNSNVLNTPVYNYSWPLFPYIWNEIRFQIAYESDLDFVATTMKRVVEEELGEEMLERVRRYRDILAKTPVDELTVNEHPAVLFRASENTWIEAIVRYLVDPKRAGRVKTDLIRKLLARLNAAPDKVLFPKSNAR
jgi:small-conductance mechanosensitive channel